MRQMIYILQVRENGKWNSVFQHGHFPYVQDRANTYTGKVWRIVRRPRF